MFFNNEWNRIITLLPVLDYTLSFPPDLSSGSTISRFFTWTIMNSIKELLWIQFHLIPSFTYLSEQLVWTC